MCFSPKVLDFDREHWCKVVQALKGKVMRFKSPSSLSQTNSVSSGMLCPKGWSCQNLISFLSLSFFLSLQVCFFMFWSVTVSTSSICSFFLFFFFIVYFLAYFLSAWTLIIWILVTYSMIFHVQYSATVVTSIKILPNATITTWWIAFSRFSKYPTLLYCCCLFGVWWWGWVVHMCV